MPRNVRPAWLAVNVDDGPVRSFGPRGHGGYLSGSLTLRTAAGSVSEPPISFDAGFTSERGARLALFIPAGYVVDLDDGEPRTLTAGLNIVARPVDDR